MSSSGKKVSLVVSEAFLTGSRTNLKLPRNRSMSIGMTKFGIEPMRQGLRPFTLY